MNRTTVLVCCLAGLATVVPLGSALAQVSPVGLWRTQDDKSGASKAEVRIVEVVGVLSGRIEKRLTEDAKPGDKCNLCSDDRQDQLVLGLEIIRGGQQVEGKNVWEGGRILDPENGRDYRLKLTPIEGGNKLEVRGSIGPFGRTQTWVRIP